MERVKRRFALSAVSEAGLLWNQFEAVEVSSHRTGLASIRATNTLDTSLSLINNHDPVLRWALFLSFPSFVEQALCESAHLL